MLSDWGLLHQPNHPSFTNTVPESTWCIQGPTLYNLSDFNSEFLYTKLKQTAACHVNVISAFSSWPVNPQLIASGTLHTKLNLIMWMPKPKTSFWLLTKNKFWSKVAGIDVPNETEQLKLASVTRCNSLSSSRVITPKCPKFFFIFCAVVTFVKQPNIYSGLNCFAAAEVIYS